jgi:hypothetical protein
MWGSGYDTFLKIVVYPSAIRTQSSTLLAHNSTSGHCPQFLQQYIYKIHNFCTCSNYTGKEKQSLCLAHCSKILIVKNNAFSCFTCGLNTSHREVQMSCDIITDKSHHYLNAQSKYWEFRERRTCLTLLPSASACETPASSSEKIYCRLALHMLCTVNTYVHF